MRNNTHPNKKLQNHYNKYGENDLQFSILLGCNKENLIDAEQFFLDSYKTYFNIRVKADSNLGCKHSKEVKLRMRETSIRLGLKPPSRLGIKSSKESNEKRSKKLSGVSHGPLPEEIKQKISKARMGQPSGRKGKHLTESTKQKIREWAIKHNIRPPSSLGKIPWNKGLKATKEACINQSKSHKGRPWSEKRRCAYNKKYNK